MIDDGWGERVGLMGKSESCESEDRVSVGRM